MRSGYAGFGVRYLTIDGAAALIKDSRRGGPVWRFIRAGCVERLSLLVTGRSIGDFPVRRGLHRAIVAFGRRYVRRGCSVSWLRPSVTVSLCRHAALITRQPIRGSALVHTWTTVAGLRLGDRARACAGCTRAPTASAAPTGSSPASARSSAALAWPGFPLSSG